MTDTVTPLSGRTNPEFRYLYFIEAARLGLVKIGVANDPRKRLATLQVGSPDKLVLRGVILTDDAPGFEARLHSEYRDLHSHGEWFRVDSFLENLMSDSLTMEEAEEAPMVIQTRWAPPSPGGRHYQRQEGESLRRFWNRMTRDLEDNPFYNDKGERVLFEREEPRGLAVSPPPLNG